MSLSSGLTLSCATGKAAGLQALYLIDAADFTSAALSSGTTSEYGTITLASGKKWYQFEFEQDYAEYRENVEGERGSYKVTHEIEFYVPGINSTNRDALQQILDNSPCGFMAVVTDSNGVNWLVGYTESLAKTRPVRLLTDASTTAKALGEVNGSTITLQSIDSEKAYTIKSTTSIVTT